MHNFMMIIQYIILQHAGQLCFSLAHLEDFISYDDDDIIITHFLGSPGFHIDAAPVGLQGHQIVLQHSQRKPWLSC